MLPLIRTYTHTQGLPFPSQEFNAIDVVVRYAVTELGFAFQDIIMYAWSIGEPRVSVRVESVEQLLWLGGGGNVWFIPGRVDCPL